MSKQEGTGEQLDTGAPKCNGAGLRGSKIVGALPTLFTPVEVGLNLLEK